MVKLLRYWILEAGCWMLPALMNIRSDGDTTHLKFAKND